MNTLPRMARKPKSKKPTTGEYVARSFTLPADVDAALMAHAQKEERSLSWVVSKALRDYLAGKAK